MSFFGKIKDWIYDPSKEETIEIERQDAYITGAYQIAPSTSSFYPSAFNYPALPPQQQYPYLSHPTPNVLHGQLSLPFPISSFPSAIIRCLDCKKNFDVGTDSINEHAEFHFTETVNQGKTDADFFLCNECFEERGGPQISKKAELYPKQETCRYCTKNQSDIHVTIKRKFPTSFSVKEESPSKDVLLTLRLSVCFCCYKQHINLWKFVANEKL